MSAKKCPLLLSKKRAWKRLLVLGPSTAHTRQQNYCPRPYIERRHPLSWLNWYVYEVLIRVHQSSQGCLKLILSFIPHGSQVNVPTGDQPFLHITRKLFIFNIYMNIVSSMVCFVGVTAFLFENRTHAILVQNYIIFSRNVTYGFIFYDILRKCI